MKDLLGTKNINSHSERGILRVSTLRMTKCEEYHNNSYPLSLRERARVRGQLLTHSDKEIAELLLCNGRGKYITPPAFLSSQSSLRNSTLPVQGGRFAKAGFTLPEGATHVGLPPVIAKAGFTLAEVLITLGIIGVVAAMTIPNLMNNIIKRRIEVQAKAAYSTIAQAMQFSDYEEASPMPISANSVASMKSWFNTFLAPHLKVENICFQTAGCWHKKGVVKTLNNGTPNFETAVGINDSTLGWATVTFRTSKGVYFNLDGSSVGTTSSLFGVDVKSPSMQFYFDVNGDSKPNVIGKDIYIMIYHEDLGLVPAGFSRTQAEVDKNCLNGNGYWCLSKLKREGWVINDKVWKRKK